MIGLFPKKHRRQVFDLQLTAMIDIFSMIIIFLIGQEHFIQGIARTGLKG